MTVTINGRDYRMGKDAETFEYDASCYGLGWRQVRNIDRILELKEIFGTTRK